jgi:hypothetical protein
VQLAQTQLPPVQVSSAVQTSQFSPAVPQLPLSEPSAAQVFVAVLQVVQQLPL